jgi:hypothetical protein
MKSKLAITEYKLRWTKTRNAGTLWDHHHQGRDSKSVKAKMAIC